jgi:hypothetical protein
MRFVILHYHILKNAGSTIEEILYWNFRERFRRFDTEDRDQVITNAEVLALLNANPEVEAVSSHQMYDPVPCVPGFIFFDLCFLRDPLDRIRSVYDYFREKPAEGDPMSELANQVTLGAFAARLIEDFPWTINDVQVNLLANGLINDQPKGLEDLERASRRMLSTAFLGVVDRFNESLIAGQHALRTFFRFHRAHEPVNVSRGLEGTLAVRIEKFREACDPPVFAELQRLNQMDYELLRRARVEVERRFNLVEDGITRLRALEGRSDVATPPSKRPRGAKAFVPVAAPGFFTKMKRLAQVIPYARVLRPGALFDDDYYRRSNPDIPAGTNLWMHFITTGAFEGRKPHPLFDCAFYLKNYPGLATAGVNPLGHYLKHGAKEGRQPHPLFDSAFYWRLYADVREAGINPLLHYVTSGADEGRKPHRLFQPDYYFSQCPEAPRKDALVQFLESENCCNPHRLFDCVSYLREHTDVEMNPLLHYVMRPVVPNDDQAEQIEVQDVRVRLIFADAGFELKPVEEQRRIYAKLCQSGEATLVWKEASGRTEFLSPSQQRPFFQAISYDQLRAQVARC